MNQQIENYLNPSDVPIYVCIRCGQKYKLLNGNPPRHCFCGGVTFEKEGE